jgi:hypothetical protein
MQELYLISSIICSISSIIVNAYTLWTMRGLVKTSIETALKDVKKL